MFGGGTLLNTNQKNTKKFILFFLNLNKKKYEQSTS